MLVLLVLSKSVELQGTGGSIQVRFNALMDLFCACFCLFCYFLEACEMLRPSASHMSARPRNDPTRRASSSRGISQVSLLTFVGVFGWALPWVAKWERWVVVPG